LLDTDTLKKFDSSLMHEAYDKWPQLARSAYESELTAVSFDNIDHIILVGMGGSGAICEVISAILSKTQIHTSVVKGYHLPNTADSKTLVIAVSVSGNTIETISVLESALAKSCHIVSFSSGGKIQQICEDKNLAHFIIPQVHSPRASFPAFLYSILNVLSGILPTSDSDVTESLDALESLQKQISTTNLTTTNPALSIAEWISGIPMLYYPWGLEPAATRFKNSLQENAKTHVISEDIVEATHNGIVAWEKSSSVVPLIIRGSDDYTKTKLLWDLLENYFKERNIEYRVINSVEGSILSKLVCLVYLCDYISIYKSVLSQIDPSPVSSINYFKQNKS